jgi:HSP20 family protein
MRIQQLVMCILSGAPTRLLLPRSRVSLHVDFFLSLPLPFYVACSKEDRVSLAQQPLVETPSFGLTPAAPPAIAQPQLAKRMLIRADVHFNALSNEMTAVFELPGLKKHDLEIKMYICPYSRVRQIIITGRSRPVLPAGVYTVQERKFGDFYRTVAVPLDTKVSLENITLS